MSPFFRDGDGRLELVCPDGSVHEISTPVLLQMQAQIAEHLRKLTINGSVILPR